MEDGSPFHSLSHYTIEWKEIEMVVFHDLSLSFTFIDHFDTEIAQSILYVFG